MSVPRSLVLLFIAAAVRSLATGFLGVVLGVYLARLHVDALRIGLVLGAGLVGGTVATAAVGRWADRIGRRRSLIVLAVLSSAAGLGLALVPPYPALLAVAFVSMLNGMGTDRSAIFALEQAIVPALVTDRNRTWALSWNNVVLDGGGALGALGGALPSAVQRFAGVDITESYRFIFLVLGLLQLSTALLYARLPVEVELAPSMRLSPVPVSPQSKTLVRRLAVLFSVDAFGGGFLGDALVSYWFFRRFGIDERALGALFFIVHLLNAASHLAAAWLARRIGLVNTMVFTHLPSSVFLLAVPLAPTASWAIGLFLCREAVVEMDVPTRQSYVAAIVSPHERTYASSVTNLTRTLSWAGASALAGVLMQNVAFSAPLIFGGSLKIAYDVMLFRRFRRLKPSEERAPDG
jgi:MFS family permease